MPELKYCVHVSKEEQLGDYSSPFNYMKWELLRNFYASEFKTGAIYTISYTIEKIANEEDYEIFEGTLFYKEVEQVIEKIKLVTTEG